MATQLKTPYATKSFRGRKALEKAKVFVRENIDRVKGVYTISQPCANDGSWFNPNHWTDNYREKNQINNNFLQEATDYCTFFLQITVVYDRNNFSE